MSKPTAAGSLKDIERKRREVFKPILDNPYTKGSEWPAVDLETQKAIVDFLAQLLSSYGGYLQLQKNKRTSLSVELTDKITLGFNSTVKRLEAQAAPNRAKVLKKSAKKTKTVPKLEAKTTGYVKYVFVCKSDISTPLLTSCFPLLTFSASKSLLDRVKLVELPRGSMSRLLKVLHTENTGIISITDDWSEGKPLFDLIDRKIEDQEVPWLHGLFEGELGEAFEKPAIKFLKTTAPIGRSTQKERNAQKKRKRERVEGGEEKAEAKKPKTEKGQ